MIVIDKIKGVYPIGKVEGQINTEHFESVTEFAQRHQTSRQAILSAIKREALPYLILGENYFVAKKAHYEPRRRN